MYWLIYSNFLHWSLKDLWNDMYQRQNNLQNNSDENVMIIDHPKNPSLNYNLITKKIFNIIQNIGQHQYIYNMTISANNVTFPSIALVESQKELLVSRVFYTCLIFQDKGQYLLLAKKTKFVWMFSYVLLNWHILLICDCCKTKITEMCYTDQSLTSDLTSSIFFCDDSMKAVKKFYLSS